MYLVVSNMYSVAKANESKVFLDLNRLFGGIKPCRLAETLTYKEISSVFFEASVWGRNKSKSVNDRVEVMKRIFIL